MEKSYKESERERERMLMFQGILERKVKVSSLLSLGEF
jgi:hypothetical protein